MRFFYRLAEEGGGWIAETEAIEAYGRGATPAEAVLDLRGVLTERFERPNAMAPPSSPGDLLIDLQPLDQLPHASLADGDELVPP